MVWVVLGRVGVRQMNPREFFHVHLCKNKESEPKNYKELYEFCETLAPPSKNIELFDKMSIIEEDERKKSMME